MGPSPPNSTTSVDDDVDYHYAYRAIVFPNGTLLILEKAGGPVPVPCGNCTSTVTIYVIIGMVIMILAPVTLIITLGNKKAQKIK